MQTDAEYRDWIRKFYEGSFLVEGWNGRVKSLVKGLDPAQAAPLQASLEALGALIAGEWARDNAVRRIDNDRLQAWGGRMKEAKAKGPGALAAEVAAIGAEARALAG